MQNAVEVSFSVIVPVYNRPYEICELLDSLSAQTNPDFEVIIVEDGSSVPCKVQTEERKTSLNIRYFYKDQEGPGLARNYGCTKATGNYYIFLDSDCTLPPDYFQKLHNALCKKYVDAFGGIETARDDFSLFQKAVNHSMTSFFTTGGIRRGNEKFDKFYARSFNMGYSQEVFEATRGFCPMYYGEDVELSIRIINSGFKIRPIKEAFVYHKRRTDVKKFAKQVYHFGRARIKLWQMHPSTFKWIYLMPSLFTLGTLMLLLLSIIVSGWFATPIVLCMLLFFIESTVTTKNIFLGLLSVVTGFTQLIGYGVGFISAYWDKVILQRFG